MCGGGGGGSHCNDTVQLLSICLGGKNAVMILYNYCRSVGGGGGGGGGRHRYDTVLLMSICLGEIKL